MKLGKVVDILQGSLLNAPCISAFLGISSSLDHSPAHKDSLRGHLFFALDQDSLQEAVARGAYGIVVEGETPILDSEIAWISVEKMQTSIKRFIRYLVGEMEASLALVSPLELHMLSRIAPGLAICEHDNLAAALGFFYELYKMESKPGFIISSLRALKGLDAPKIYSKQYKKILKKENEKEEKTAKPSHLSLTSFSLLESKIMQDSLSFSLGFPPLFLPFVESALALLDELNFGSKSKEILEPSLFQSHEIDFGTRMHARQDLKTSEGSSPNTESKKQAGMKALQQVEFFEPIRHSFPPSKKSRILIFCKDAQALNISHLDIDDFCFGSEAISLMRGLLPKIKESSHIDLTLSAYFDSQASHLSLVSLFYNKEISSRIRSKSTPMHSKLGFSHIAHLYEILSKIAFDIAIIYGSSKGDFLKLASSQVDSKSKNQKSLFD